MNFNVQLGRHRGTVIAGLLRRIPSGSILDVLHHRLQQQLCSQRETKMTPEQLKKIRKDQRMKQKDFAKAIGCSQGMISNYEKGHWPIPWRIEKAIIVLFDPTPEDVYVPLPVPKPKDRGYIEDCLPRDVRGMPKSCRGCVHRTRTGSISICDYIHDTGVPRGCLVKDCWHYQEGKRADKSIEWNSGIG